MSAVHRRTLQALVSAPGPCLAVPGCWDGLSALLIQEAGFPAAFLSGGALSMGRLGRPDMGFVDARVLEDAVTTIRDRLGDLPLIVDADDGFGSALNVAHTVRRLERAGASALQIEDQRAPKRCGHMAGKSVIPPAEMAGKVRAAVDARDDAALLIVARTDALALEGLNAALDRAALYAEAGADLLFIEGPPTMADIEAIATRFAAEKPLVHNLVEGGVTPVHDGAALDALGFRIALHPLILLHTLLREAPGVLAHLRANRETASLRPALPTLRDANAVTGAVDLLARGVRYAGE